MSELMTAIRDSWDPGDRWGSCMGWLFAIADEMYTRGDGPPDEWEYRPGLAINGDVRVHDSHEFGPCSVASGPELEQAGRVLWRMRSILIAAGEDY